MPRRGPVILAPNHTSFCDSFFLPLVLRPAGDVRGEGRVLRLVEDRLVLPFRRADPHAPGGRVCFGAGTRGCAETFSNSGGVLGIYPEGTRSPDGRLYRGHTGVARLALQCGAPVIPVGITGTTDVQPVGSNMMRPFKRVGIQFGSPLDLTMLGADTPSDPLVLRRVTDDLMFEIRELTGQEYVDRYAKRHNVVGGTDTASIEPLRPIPGAADRRGARGSDGLIRLTPSCQTRSTARQPRQRASSRHPTRESCWLELRVELPKRRRALRAIPTPLLQGRRAMAAPNAVVSVVTGLATGAWSWSARSCRSRSITDAPPSTRRTSSRAEPCHRSTSSATSRAGHGVDDVSHLEGHRLDHRPCQMGAPDPSRQPDDRAARVRVPPGLPRPVKAGTMNTPSVSGIDSARAPTSAKRGDDAEPVSQPLDCGAASRTPNPRARR